LGTETGDEPVLNSVPWLQGGYGFKARGGTNIALPQIHRYLLSTKIRPGRDREETEWIFRSNISLSPYGRNLLKAAEGSHQEEREDNFVPKNHGPQSN